MNGFLRKVAFYTLACKVNQYETEAMRELFVNRGDQVVDSDSPADIYVINTCTVTGMSDKKSRQVIRRFKRQNPEAVIAVVGCYSQIAPAEVMAIEGVNLVMGTHQRGRILDYLEGLEHTDQREVVTDIGKIREFEEMTVDRIEGRTPARAARCSTMSHPVSMARRTCASSQMSPSNNAGADGRAAMLRRLMAGS